MRKIKSYSVFSKLKIIGGIKMKFITNFFQKRRIEAEAESEKKDN